MTEFVTRNHGHSCFEINIKTTNEEHYFYLQNEARKCVDNILPADAETVKHGRWIEKELTGIKSRRHIKYTIKFCSECNMSNGRKRANYCPNCGAKMDGKEENHEDI